MPREFSCHSKALICLGISEFWLHFLVKLAIYKCPELSSVTKIKKINICTVIFLTEVAFYEDQKNYIFPNTLDLNEISISSLRIDSQ